MQDLIEELIKLTCDCTPFDCVDGTWFTSSNIDVVALARLMLEHQFRLSTVTGVERLDGETDVIYHFIQPEKAVNIRTTTKHQHLPSIANVLPSANWIEREIRDLYAVQFDGHPDPRPLVRPKEMPEGFFRAGVIESAKKEREEKQNAV
ncbi:MAG: NADH-quinone oxidoreductase subunit C [Anaerolineaceae bacterium]|jgi:NADH-quinone oxidoreductase subunit C